jgi:hypothetical protein
MVDIQYASVMYLCRLPFLLAPKHCLHCFSVENNVHSRPYIHIQVGKSSVKFSFIWKNRAFAYVTDKISEYFYVVNVLLFCLL